MSSPPCAIGALRPLAEASRRHGKKSAAASPLLISALREETEGQPVGPEASAAPRADARACARSLAMDFVVLEKTNPMRGAMQRSRDRRTFSQQHGTARAGGGRQISGTPLDKFVSQHRERDGFLCVGIDAELGAGFKLQLRQKI